MAAAKAPCDGSVARMRLICSHGGRFLPCGPDGALRYIGGETRVLVVPRTTTFPYLTARLSEMAGGAEVRAVRHHLADESDPTPAHQSTRFDSIDPITAPMAPVEPASRRRSDDTDMKLVCSHGGRFFLPSCGHDGEPRYVGGETRVLVVPRAVSFRELAARLAEMVGSGGGGSASSAEQVRAINIRHRLADEGLADVLVTVTCDEEVAHMRDEYDRLRATRPAARFRVFVTATAASSAAGGPKRATTTTTRAGLPPLPPRSSMRRVQSDQAVAARAQQHQHRPTRRVHSALELVGGVHMQMQPPSFHQHLPRCCSCSFCQPRRDRYTTAPPPARPTYALPYMSKKQATAPPLSVYAAAERVATVSTKAAAAREKATNRDVEAAMENRRAIWELE